MKMSFAFAIAALLASTAAPAAAQTIPPAAGSWLQCSALGIVAERGAPDPVAKKAAAEIHQKYKLLFATYLQELQGATTLKVMEQRIETSLKALAGDRKALTKTEEPQLLACQKDLDRLTSDIPDTARKMAAATPKPEETKLRTEMWATCAVAMSWAIESGLSHDANVRDGARRYRQMFYGVAHEQGMKKEAVEQGLDALKKLASTKSPNELKSAISSCLRELP